MAVWSKHRPLVLVTVDVLQRTSKTCDASSCSLNRRRVVMAVEMGDLTRTAARQAIRLYPPAQLSVLLSSALATTTSPGVNEAAMSRMSRMSRKTTYQQINVSR